MNMTPDQLRDLANMIECKGALSAKETAEHYRAHADALEETERLQARVDALMLEYCPDEMTPEQLAEWEKHQRAVPAERKIERLKGHAEAMHTGIKHDVKFCLLRPNEWAEKAADAYRREFKGE